MTALLNKVVNKVRRQFPPTIHIMQQYGVSSSAESMPEANNDLERYFFSTTGRKLHKWHHYLEVYDKFFSPFRETPVRMLEIGVMNGGSLEMWRNYFGPDAIIYGIDINPNCAQFDGEAGMVRIGSQTDREFLSSVVKEMGGIDIVLDDGSHRSEHMRKSLETLFPLLNDGGVYVVEDTHACYWTDHGGGYNWPGNFLRYARSLIDDMHHWYHRRKVRTPSVQEGLWAVHFYDSMVVFEKRLGFRPRHGSGGAVAAVKLDPRNT